MSNAFKYWLVFIAVKMEDEYQPEHPEAYRPTFPLDFTGQRYEYQRQNYQKPSSGYVPEGRAPAGAGIDSLLKSDLYISGQTIESIVAMISVRYSLKKRIHSELDHLRGSIQDRIGETMYFGNRVSSMVKRRGDLEKELIQLDREGIREEQAFWKDISRLAKELRYKLEQYGKEKAKREVL